MFSSSSAPRRRTEISTRVMSDEEADQESWEADLEVVLSTARRQTEISTVIVVYPSDGPIANGSTRVNMVEVKQFSTEC